MGFAGESPANPPRVTRDPPANSPRSTSDLPAITQRCHHRALGAPVAADGRAQAVGDVALVEQVGHVQRDLRAGQGGADSTQVVADGGVHQGDGGQGVAVVQVAVEAATVRDARAHAHALQRTFAQGVVGPQRGLVAWHENHLVAALGGDVGLGDFAIAQRIRHRQVQPVVKAGLAFQLDALHLRFARLHHKAGVDRVGRADVFLRDLEGRQRDKAVVAVGLVFHAGLVLLSGGGLERRAVARNAGHRLERGRVAEVRRDAVVKAIGHAGAAGEAVGIGRARRPAPLAAAARDAVVGGALGPVITAGEGEAQAVQFDLVLRVQAQLAARHVDFGGRGRARHGCAVVGVEHVEQRRSRGQHQAQAALVVAGFFAQIVQAEGDVMARRACVEFGVQLVVDLEGMRGFRKRPGVADGLRVRHHRADLHAPRVGVDVGVAGALAQAPRVVQAVVQRVADHGLFVGEDVVAGLAHEAVARDVAGRGAFFQRADNGQNGGAATAVAGDLLVLRADVQAGVG